MRRDLVSPADSSQTVACLNRRNRVNRDEFVREPQVRGVIAVPARPGRMLTGHRAGSRSRSDAGTGDGTGPGTGARIGHDGDR
ncbi:hypothetical protein GCM10010103_67920 [Streptomyces paradoxus]